MRGTRRGCAACLVLALLTVQGTLALWTVTATSKSQSVQAADFAVTAAAERYLAAANTDGMSSQSPTCFASRPCSRATIMR